MLHRHQSSLVIDLPYKSVAGALWFTVLLGPVGLLYASFWGGFFMILLGIIVVSSKFIFPMILVWLISCIWSVGAVERHNRRILRGYRVEHAKDNSST